MKRSLKKYYTMTLSKKAYLDTIYSMYKEFYAIV